MDVTTGTNCLTKAEDRLATALAASSAFQSLTGTTTAAAAQERVFSDYWPKPLLGETKDVHDHEHLSAGVLLYSPDETPYVVALSSDGNIRANGNTAMVFRRIVSSEDRGDMPEVERFLKNALGDVIDDVFDYTRINDGIDWLQNVIMVTPPRHNGRTMLPVSGDLHECEMLFAWGVED